MNDKITITDENIATQELQSPPVKSKIIIGNLTIFNTKKFNWFQKKMIKLCFGFEVNNLESKSDK